MTRYHKKTKEVEPEIKEVTHTGEQLAGDCSREGQSLCLDRVKLGKNHRVSGGRGLSLECAEPRGETCCPCRARVGESTGRRLSACRAGQAAQKALSTGGKAWPVTEPLCTHGTVQHVGAGWGEAGTSALLSSPSRREIPTQYKRTRSPACGRTRRPAPVPVLALCDLGLAFCIHKTGGHAPFIPALPASTSTEPGFWGRGCPGFTLPWALLECEPNFLHPQWNPVGFCPQSAAVITRTPSHRKGRSPEMQSFVVCKALRVTPVYLPNGLLASEGMKSGR